jgi:hypothetical protein
MAAGLNDWEMNFIQGVVNQLQIEFTGLLTRNRGTKNQINTSYKMMEVSVTLGAQLVGSENNRSVSRITHMFAQLLSVYCCTDKCDTICNDI